MNTEYLNNFEEKLQQELLHLCTNYGIGAFRYNGIIIT